MKPDLRQEDQTAGLSKSEKRQRNKFQRALNILSDCYNQVVADLADSVCEEEELIVDGAGFALGEIENRYSNRLRDLQALICSLRDYVTPQQPRPAAMDELHCTKAELSTVLSEWIQEHPYADIVQILLHPVDENDVRVIPVYYAD